MAENLIELTDDNFKESISKETVLVDFWAPWCAPCNMIAPIIEELANEYKGKIKVCKLNVDSNQMSAADLGIVSIPTMIIFKEGREETRVIGAMAKEKIKEKIDLIISK